MEKKKRNLRILLPLSEVLAWKSVPAIVKHETVRHNHARSIFVKVLLLISVLLGGAAALTAYVMETIFLKLKLKQEGVRKCTVKGQQ